MTLQNKEMHRQGDGKSGEPDEETRRAGLDGHAAGWLLTIRRGGEATSWDTTGGDGDAGSVGSSLFAFGGLGDGQGSVEGCRDLGGGRFILARNLGNVRDSTCWDGRLFTGIGQRLRDGGGVRAVSWAVRTAWAIRAFGNIGGLVSFIRASWVRRLSLRLRHGAHGCVDGDGLGSDIAVLGAVHKDRAVGHGSCHSGVSSAGSVADKACGRA